ncbi:MAG: VCBS repeat-containing protein, partial [Acidobacteriaceae bacterium]
MSRSFSLRSSRGFSLRLASAAFCTASLVSILAVPSSARAQGLFQPPSPTLTAGTAPQGVAAADFNRSGFMGLVVANSHVSGGGGGNSTVSVFLGTGNNAYGTGHAYSSCKNPTAVLAQDVNNDGYPDIIVACTSSSTIGVLLNLGTGTFGTVTNYTFTGNPIALVSGDFLGNGRVDIAAANSGGNIDVLVNNGTGTFSKSTVNISGTLSGIAAGDFNNDGHLDLAVSDSGGNKVDVLTGSGTGTFTLHGTGSAVGTGTKPSDIVAADFNNDGNLDVATTNAGNNTATILKGDGSGALTVQAAQATGTDPIAIVATDVNGDGAPDVVAFDELSTSTGEVDVLLGNGNGTLQIAQTISQGFLPGTQAVVADFNRDGKPDIALAQQNLNNAS